MLRAAPRASPGLALARGLVLGDTGLFEADRVQDLRRAGLAHLLAVSGFNVAVLLAVVGAGAGRRRRWPRAALFVATIALYLALVGGAPSLQRASIMALAGVLVFVLKRPGSAPQALALAAGLLVAVAPEALFDVGFQLSFGATACLLLFAARWGGAFGPLPRPLGAALATSLAAQVGTLPSSIEAFGGVAPVAPLLNLLAIPWSAVWMVVDLLWTGLALLSPPAARLAGPVLDVGAWPLSALEALPPSPWIAAWVSGGWLAGTALALAVVGAIESLGTRFARLWLLAPLLLASERGAPGGETMALFADVGQGDAALIVGGAASVLVDGGGMLGRDLGSAVLWPLVTARAGAHLDLVILSHADSDHCAGLASLARYVSFEQVWLPPLVGFAPCVEKLAATAGARARWPREGDRFERPGLVVEVLHPRGSDRPSDDNAASLVVRVDAGGRSILLPGDVGGLTERAVAARAGALLRCDLLKVPHHGSSTSSGVELLAAARPRWAVVSAGARNSFGHPSDAVLQRLAARGVRTLRTDLQGEVVLRWRDGEPMRLELPAAPRRAPP
jgi:competence protein ComEC